MSINLYAYYGNPLTGEETEIALYPTGTQVSSMLLIDENGKVHLRVRDAAARRALWAYTEWVRYLDQTWCGYDDAPRPETVNTTNRMMHIMYVKSLIGMPDLVVGTF
jgi:hypothetical protein